MPGAQDRLPHACFDCRRAFKRKPEGILGSVKKCPNCGGDAVMLYHTFRPPKAKDDKGWKKVQLLAENGFFFQKIYENGRHNGEIQPYPRSIEEVEGFVTKFKSQSISPEE